MNLLSHQFRKDCFRLRVPIALWLLLVLLRAALITPGLAEPGDDASQQVLYRIFTTLVPFLQNILLVVMVPLLIHEEPLVGTTAFWFTRPIDGWLLLRSKMLFIAVIFILAPLLTEIAILAIHGASARQLALACPEILIEDLKFLAYVVVLAALTLTFARYALWGSSIFIGYYLVAIGASLLHLYIDMPSFLRGTQSPSLGDSQYVASTFALIAFAVMILAYQYRSRDTRGAWLGVGGAIFAVFMIDQFWPWDFMPHRNHLEQAEVDTSAVKVTVSSDPRSRRISDAYRIKSKEAPKKLISGRLEISGLPSGYVAEPSEVKASLKLMDGTVITHQDREYSFDRKWDANVVQHTLGDTKILNPEKGNAGFITLLSLNDDLFGKYSTVPGEYDAEVEFVLKRYDAVGSLQVKPKARYDRRTEHTVITQVLKQTGAATVLLRESEVSLFFAGDRHSQELGFNPFGQPTLYVLRNDKQAEALWPTKEIGPGFEFLDLFQKRLRTIPLALRYSALTNRGQALTELNDMWLASAEIVRIEAKEVGRFKKTVRVDDFVMRAQ